MSKNQENKPVISPASEIEFKIERAFNAPRDLVWKAHSEADHLKHWWGPKGCTVSVKLFEFRPGGLFHYGMHYSTGSAMWGRFFYREIEANKRIVWLNSFATETGGIARAPFSQDCPLEMHNVMTLTEHNGKTTLTLRSTPFGANAQECKFFADLHGSMQQGFGGTYDQLSAYLAKL